ncbi:hypothetical protein EIN_468330 [Entamoeba invadens IP1]|uniref:Rho-GAP domain-containing protein n=1 Tax=Entamoeba invadens IP1 TaxID=370355 RepID=A0A0A1TUJ2_ENTIV|nr:hypothetical protein EIN_468330 [Entamoeba invadens IP1]ELP83699.1 hypothetical protein EIN_468330 [Entamoeba invadens IP1]|eukprot:XP_004183045.1 hypothetical protein EIN_468330 [Entamoeba invadens IP1]
MTTESTHRKSSSLESPDNADKLITILSDQTPTQLRNELIEIVPPEDHHKEVQVDQNTKTLISFLEKTKRPSQRMTTTLEAVIKARHHNAMTKYNTKYGKKSEIMQSCRRTFEGELATQNAKITLETLLESKKMLEEKISMMNSYFAEMNEKKLQRMYDIVVSYITQEGLTDTVEYSFENSKYKTKKVILRSNFLVVCSSSGKSKDVFYLYNPVVEKESDCSLRINQTTKIKFQSNEVREKWVSALRNLTIWVESIPRTVINQEGGITGLDKVDITFNATKSRPSLNSKNSVVSSSMMSIPSSPPIQKKEPVEIKKSSDIKKHTKTLSLFARKDKDEKKDDKKDEKGQKKEDKSDKSKDEKKSEKDEKTRVNFFGIKLEKYGEEHNTNNIPLPIKALIDYLKIHAANVEGIFRICGNQDTVQNIKERLQCLETDFFDDIDIYSLGSVLKQYIREIPGQVLPTEIDKEFLELLKQKNNMTDEEMMEKYKLVFKKLPKIIAEFVEELTELFFLISQHAETNKMSVTNIFICLGPALRGCPFCFNYATANHKTVFAK